MFGRNEEYIAQRNPGFSRCMFIEVCFRLAKLIYATNAAYDKQDEKSYKHVMKVKSAFSTFFKLQILPFMESENINWKAFRDSKLNDRDVELVFTMNMNHIDVIYIKYSKMN